MGWMLTVAGVLVLVAVRDIFHTLWHPGGFGTLSRVVFSATWWAAKRGRRGGRKTELAGPLGVLGTLAAWALFTVTGFGLIYLPQMTEGFTFGSSLRPEQSADLVDVLYLSFVALTTLGLGDILPSTPVLRFLVPLEALCGFLLLTAGISWILQLYPALIRRRALARRLTTMGRHRTADLLETGEPGIAVQYLEGLRADLASVEMDLLQYGESYYFREIRSELSLAATLPQVAVLAGAGTRSAAPEVRIAARMLEEGLAEFLTLLRREFLRGLAEDGDILAAYARDHLQPAPSP